MAAAKNAGARTEREQAFIGAVAHLFTDGDKRRSARACSRIATR